MLQPGRFAIWTAAVLLTAACAGRPAPPANLPTATTLATAASRAIFPAASWERIEDPSSAGYCADRLAAVTTRAKEVRTTAMMVVLGGRSLYEYGNMQRVSYVASVRKSVLAMLFGKYVAARTIRLDRTLADLEIRCPC